MKKTIIISGTSIPLSASAGALIHYKKQFGTEYTDDYKQLKELSNDSQLQTEKFAQIALRLLWAMAVSADRNVAPFEDWIVKYQAKELFGAISTAQELFNTSLSKIRSSGQGNDFTSERLLAQALICGLSVDDLDDLPLPMVISTIESWCKVKGYAEDDARPATQADFDAL